MAKAIVPKMVGEVIDRAMQVHGAEGICRAFPLPLPSLSGADSAWAM